MYISDWGGNPKIEKCSMASGSSCATIVDSNVLWPNGLAIGRRFLGALCEYMQDVASKTICFIWQPIVRAGFIYRLSRLKPRVSRSKGASSKPWYAYSQLPVQNEFDKYPPTIQVVTNHEL